MGWPQSVRALNAWPEGSTDPVTTLTDRTIGRQYRMVLLRRSGTHRVCELVVLEGSDNGLRFERRKTPIERDGMSWLVGCDHTFVVTNYRAAAKNPGE